MVNSRTVMNWHTPFSLTTVAMFTWMKEPTLPLLLDHLLWRSLGHFSLYNQTRLGTKWLHFFLFKFILSIIFIWSPPTPRFAYIWLYAHFSQVLTHEFGHSLGLSHSNVRSSIMWPYQQNMRDPKLGDNDIWRIQRHYGTGAEIGVVKTLSGISPGGQVGWRLVQFSA